MLKHIAQNILGSWYWRKREIVTKNLFSEASNLVSRGSIVLDNSLKLGMQVSRSYISACMNYNTKFHIRNSVTV